MPIPSSKSCARRTKGSLDVWCSARFRIQNETGLHTRPATALAQLAKTFPAQIKIKKGKMIVDAKSILHLLTLEADYGEIVEVSAKGIGAQEALKRIGQLIQNGFNE